MSMLKRFLDRKPDQTATSPVELTIEKDLAFTQIVRLTYGSKDVKLTYWKDENLVEGYVRSNPDRTTEKKAGETRSLFHEIHVFCQKLADTKKQPIRYKLYAKHPTMQKWAAQYSNDIFQWDGPAENTPEGPIYSKTYHPQSET